jgi:hypothetical protein
MRIALPILALVMTTLTGCPSAEMPLPPGLGAEIEEGQVYIGGDTVKQSRYGISFTVPEGWTGALEQQVFVLEHDHSDSVIAVGGLEESLTKSFFLLNGRFNILGSVYIGDEIFGSFRLVSPSMDLFYSLDMTDPVFEPLIGRGFIQEGDFGISGTFLGWAPQLEVDAMDKAFGDIAQNLQFFERPPEIAYWYDLVSGWVVRVASSSSDESWMIDLSDCKRVWRLGRTDGETTTSQYGHWAIYGGETSGTLVLSLDNGARVEIRVEQDANGELVFDGEPVEWRTWSIGFLEW